MGIASASFLFFVAWLVRNLEEVKKDLNKEINALRGEVEKLRTEVELHDAFITPLNQVFQQQLATALFRTNPFTSEENAAAQRYLEKGARYADDQDLLVLRRGLGRVLKEVDKEVDKLVFGGLLAGVSHEWRRRNPLPAPNPEGPAPIG